ncbi:MAG: DUF5683 domain-containing protein [Gammaproteobacteria bacterium]|nr:DUF5683 domain-containing protein [Gammaproteobacteria bacterium]
MNQSTKAALLSALVFPGVGQIVNGHKKRGWSFIGLMMVILYLLISKIMQQASMVIAEMQKKGTPINVEEISKLSSELVSFSDNMFLNIALLLLIVTWIVSVIDAYRSGKK